MSDQNSLKIAKAWFIHHWSEHPGDTLGCSTFPNSDWTHSSCQWSITWSSKKCGHVPSVSWQYSRFSIWWSWERDIPGMKKGAIFTHSYICTAWYSSMHDWHRTENGTAIGRQMIPDIYPMVSDMQILVFVVIESKSLFIFIHYRESDVHQ